MTFYDVSCDFCGGTVASTDELTILPVDRFEIAGVISNMSWGWGACLTCKPYLVVCVEAHGEVAMKTAIDALVEHALSEHRKRDGEPIDEIARVHFAITYIGLLIHQNAPLRKWEPEVDESGEET